MGQSFLASQSKFGKKIKNESSAPSQIHGVSQQCALAGHEQRQEEREPEKKRRVLIQNSDSGHKPEQEPQALRSLYGSIRSAIADAQHPEHRFKGIHGQEIVHGQVNGAKQHRGRGKDLRVPAPAEFAHDPRCD